VYDLLTVLTEGGFKASLGQSLQEVDNPDDLLSALEHAMGTDGKAASIVCSVCGKSDLVCLSRVSNESKEVGWFCKNCGSCCDCKSDTSIYSKVPWDPECITEHNNVPDDPICRLREPLLREDFEHLLQHMPNRKAPGENLVPAELWKIAPEPARTILFNTINNMLAGSDSPAHWRGGIVQFLFNKPPATDISNWHPVCLLNTSNRLFSSIITRRLNRIAEEHDILDHVQEAFRRKRNT
jgi:hypothetical protein